MRETVYIVRVQAMRPHVDRHSSTCVTEHAPDVAAIEKYAARHGVVVEVVVEEVSLLSGNGMSEVATWLDSIVDRDPKPVVERDRRDVLIDELHRAQRNQDRKLQQLADLVEKMAAMQMARSVPPGVPTPPTPRLLNEESVRKAAELYGVDVDEASVREAAGLPEPAKPARVLPMRGPVQHIEHGAADVTSALRENMTAGVNRVVPGNMGLRGAAVSSEVFVVDIGDDGKPGVVKGALPKVGDTLKPIGG